MFCRENATYEMHSISVRHLSVVAAGAVGTGWSSSCRLCLEVARILHARRRRSYTPNHFCLTSSLSLRSSGLDS
jgi:hypothetical protein